MKLQNKYTGRVLIKYTIRALEGVDADKGNERIVLIDDETHDEWNYYTFASFSDEWEDYEEPKEHWYINYQGEVYVLDPNAVPEYSRNAREIGNYFETEEEANKAVEKLKAWKRLRDKGFERVFSLQLRDALCGGKTAEFKLLIDDKDLIEDIKLLFGREE